MDLDYVFARCVSGEWTNPDESVPALFPFRNEGGHRGIWIRYTLALSYFKLELWADFDELSRRFCFDDDIGEASFHAARIEALKLRITYLRRFGKDISKEATAYLTLSPTAFQLNVLKGTSFYESTISNFVFDFDEQWIGPLGEINHHWRPTAIGLKHPSAESLPNILSPIVRTVYNVEYMSWKGEQAAFRDSLLYGELSRNTSFVDHRLKLLESGIAPVSLKGTALVLSDLFDGSNYCHWTVDWLPRLSLAIKAHKEINFVCIRGINGSAHRETLETICIEHRIKIIDTTDFHWLAFDSLVTVDNNNIGSTHPAWQGNAEVVNGIRNVFGPQLSRNEGYRFYISRQDARTRRVANEKELEDGLREFNFQKIETSRMSAREQAVLFGKASCCIGPHGAGLTNMAFMPNGSLIVEFFHYNGGTSSYIPIARCLEHKYAYLVCGSNHEDLPHNDWTYRGRLARYHDAELWIDVDLLKRWLRNHLI